MTKDTQHSLGSEQLAREVQLLLSWQKQAKRAQKGAQPGGSEGLRLSRKRLHRAKRHGRKEVVKLAARLRGMLEAQGALPTQVAAKNCTPTQANERNRRLQTEIEHLRAEIAEYNRLLAAGTPEAAGGFIDLPLDAYAAEVSKVAPPMLNRTDRTQILVAAILLVVSVLGIVYFTLGQGEVTFEAALPNSLSGTVHITCHNGTARGIILYAPWSLALAGEAGTRDFGVDVYVREEGEETYRLFPSPGHAWTVEGTPTAQIEPLNVEPGLPAKVELHLAAMGAASETAEALQVVCARGDGHVVYTVDIPLAELRAAQ